MSHRAQTFPVFAAALAVALGSAACLPPDDTPEPPADAGSVDDGGINDDAGIDAGVIADIAWEPCQLLSYPQSPLEANMAAECAMVSVPLHWSDEVDDPANAGRTVELFVKRIDPPQPAVADLWMVNGGPGGDTVTFERLLNGLIPAWGNVRVYLTEARGAGRSTRLSCPAEEAFESAGSEAIVDEEWPACLTHLDNVWGEGLAAFNTTNTARDLAFLGEQLRDDVPVFAYGVSYGTYWLHRILQLDDHPFDGMILDSLVHAEEPKLAHIDAWHDRVGRDYLALCVNDDDCRAHLGDDPVAFAEDVLTSFEDGHCPELEVEGENLRDLFRVMMGAVLSSTNARTIIPGLLFRAQRCSADDVVALHNAMVALFGAADEPQHESQLLFSRALAMHVVLSEMWNVDAAETAALIADTESHIMGKNIVPHFGAYLETWPTYAPDAFDGTWASTDTPLLMFNGSLDPSTPLDRAEPYADVFNGTHQHFLAFDGVSHSAAFSSWVPDRNSTCGILTMSQFLRDPTGNLDVSCEDEVDIPLFEASPNLVNAVFGTNDLYD